MRHNAPIHRTGGRVAGGGGGNLHPPAPADPGVTVSCHRVLLIRQSVDRRGPTSIGRIGRMRWSLAGPKKQRPWPTQITPNYDEATALPFADHYAAKGVAAFLMAYLARPVDLMTAEVRGTVHWRRLT